MIVHFPRLQRRWLRHHFDKWTAAFGWSAAEFATASNSPTTPWRRRLPSGGGLRGTGGLREISPQLSISLAGLNDRAGSCACLFSR